MPFTERHSLEEEAKALQQAVKSPQRRHITEHLLSVGDYYHNICVFESGCGQLILLRRPVGALRVLQLRDYTPCPGCRRIVAKSARRHV
jgi:hypothetical protein